jgi:hypothetical protein
MTAIGGIRCRSHKIEESSGEDAFGFAQGGLSTATALRFCEVQPPLRMTDRGNGSSPTAQITGQQADSGQSPGDVARKLGKAGR